MDNGLTKYKHIFIWLSCLYILLGLILIIWPTASAYTVCYVAGAIVLIIGIAKMFSYFSKRSITPIGFTFDLAYGIIMALLGLFMLIFPGIVVSALPIALGILIIFDSIIRLQIAFEFKKNGYDKWKLSLILALITIAFGIAMLFNPFAGAAALTVFVGIALLAAGIVNLWDYIYIKHALK